MLDNWLLEWHPLGLYVEFYGSLIIHEGRIDTFESISEFFFVKAHSSIGKIMDNSIIMWHILGSWQEECWQQKFNQNLVLYMTTNTIKKGTFYQFSV